MLDFCEGLPLVGTLESYYFYSPSTRVKNTVIFQSTCDSRYHTFTLTRTSNTGLSLGGPKEFSFQQSNWH